MKTGKRDREKGEYHREENEEENEEEKEKTCREGGTNGNRKHTRRRKQCAPQSGNQKAGRNGEMRIVRLVLKQLWEINQV